MVSKIGWCVGVLLLAAAPGCDLNPCGCLIETPGTPSLSLGPVDGGGVIATSPNPCVLDVDFGTLPLGQGTSTTIHVENVGTGALDLAQVNPTLSPEFGLSYGRQQPIYSGEFGEFAVTFEASAQGTVNSSFTIQTDGVNPECPNGVNSILTIALTGSASN